MGKNRNEGRIAPLPPLTNRGVERPSNDLGIVPCPDREHLSVMVDWCQLTVKGLSPKDIAERLLGIPHWLMSNDFRGGLKGGYHALMHFDDIRVYEPSGKNKDNGYQVVMAGKGCRNFEKFLEAHGETWYDFFKRALSYDVNIPRIDLAIDDRKTYFKISRIAKMAQEGLAVTRLRLGNVHSGFGLGGDKKYGDTVYFGSRSSEFHMCFYEKGYEQAEKLGLEEDKIDKSWNRYELRFRQKRAVSLARALADRRDVASVAMEVLNESIRFVQRPEGSKDKRARRYGLWEPWAWFMRDVGKLKLAMKPEMKDYYERLAWLEKYVMPTFKAYLKIDEIMGARTMEGLLERTHLDKKHLWMIETCVRQLQAEEEVFKEKEKIARDRMELYERGFVRWDGLETPFDGS